MSNLIDNVLSMPEWVALLIVFALPALEASAFVGFVFPGEIAVILGGVLASQHKIGLMEVIALAVSGAVIGDAIGYFVGKRWGRRFMERTFGRIPVVGHHVTKSLPQAEAYLARRGGSAVFFGRWTAALRVLVPGLAGMAGVRYRTFAIFNLLGGLAWATTFVLLGYGAGKSYRRVEHFAGRLGLLLLLLVVVVVIVLAIGRWVARHPERVRSFWARQLERPRVARFRARYRRQIDFLLNRFRPGTAVGLSLTVSFVMIGLASWAAGIIGQDVVANEELTRVDLPVKHFFDAHRTHLGTTWMKILTELGSWAFLVPVFLGIALLWRWRRKTWLPLVMFAASIGGVALLRFVVGQLVDRPRPFPPAGLGPFTGPSFPSGHTVKTVAAYGMLAALYSRETRSWARRVAAWMGAFIVSLVVGFTRLYLGAHWLTDVLGAYALGTAWLFALLFTLGAVRGRGLQLPAREPSPDPMVEGPSHRPSEGVKQ
ncbi:MAG: bifunctional DedA family/phosphatase PAP2 family protein [Actinomycetota bacterium]|nr:bifunctional DedA family/phosphatase PAP2 family protein [Actinomycetota bacterium]